MPKIRIIADSISVLSDDKLSSYESTGTRLADPAEAPKKEFRRRKPAGEEAAKPKSTDVPTVTISKPKSSSEKISETKSNAATKSTTSAAAKSASVKSASTKSESAKPDTAGATKTATSEESEAPKRIIAPEADPRSLKLFVLVENPQNTATLTSIRELCDESPGFSEIILVLKDGEIKKPLRMPFRIEASPELISGLKELVGENSVVLK